MTTFARPVQAGPGGWAGRLPYGGAAGQLAVQIFQISSIGSWILGASTFVFLYNIYKTWKYGEKVTADVPWGYGNSLEWAASCPPPRHNFIRMPRIRSERPAFDLHYPNVQSGRTHEQRLAERK